MTLFDRVNNDIKSAMMAKEKEKLEALRGIKAAFLVAKTEKGASDELPDDAAMKILQKMAKQRREAADIYTQQQRPELAEVELFQAQVIEAYLPKPLSEDEIKDILKDIIVQVGASGPSDMGKVMGVASKQLAGKADGKVISALVKVLLG